jgi:hypothetical protein
MSRMHIVMTTALAVALASVPAARGGDPVADVIFRCTTRSEAYAGVITLREDGTAVLSGSKGALTFTCPLELLQLSYSPGAIVANMHVSLARGPCRGQNGVVEDRALLKELDVQVPLSKQGREDASVQWISYLQPAPCVVQVFERERAARAARSFEERADPR